jgi:hypothetical protein
MNTHFFSSELKRQLKTIQIDGCRCNERPKGKTEGSKLLSYTLGCVCQEFKNILHHVTLRIWCVFVYYEAIQRELKRRLINECRYDERLKVKPEGSTRLVYTGLCGVLGRLKIGCIWGSLVFIYPRVDVVYYESMKRKIKIKPIYECWCNGRLQTKRFTHLSYTGLVVELEHLKIKTRLTNEKFVSVSVSCTCDMRCCCLL